MVFVNGRKFACSACVKGHRSSTCAHSDRPLFEIQKKGRPITQCEDCRNLRKTKRAHIKCTCNDPKQSNSSGSSSAQAVPVVRIGARKIPTVPTLPSGVKELLGASTTPRPPTPPADPRQKVETLLNPCPCKSAWSCKCRKAASKSVVRGEASSRLNRVAGPTPRKECPLGRPLTQVESPLHRMQRSAYMRNKPYDRASGPVRHHKHHRAGPPLSDPVMTEDLALPPILNSSDANIPNELDECNDIYLSLIRPPTTTTRPVLPSLDAIVDKCCCGKSCACLGCKEHRGIEAAMASGEDCPDNCGTCRDMESGFELNPLAPANGESERIDVLLARAAATLPPPPSATRADLDPTNIRIFSSIALANRNAALAAGLVGIPPLQCCGGRCKCPSDQCGCGENCGGACGLDANGPAPDETSQTGPSPSQPTEPTRPLRSCCATKRANQGANNTPLEALGVAPSVEPATLLLRGDN